MEIIIMTTLVKFNTLSDKAYNQATALFTGESAADNQELFYNWIATSALKYFEHKDATHLNRAVNGAKSRGFAFVAVAKKLSAHKWDVKKQAFVGTMNKQAMQSMLNLNDDGVAEFEAVLFKWIEQIAERVANQGADKAETVLTLEQVEKRADSLMNKAGKSGITLEQMKAIFDAKLAEYAQSKAA